MIHILFLLFLLLTGCTAESMPFDFASTNETVKLSFTIQNSSDSRSVSTTDEAKLRTVRVIIFKSSPSGLDLLEPVVNRVYSGSDPIVITESVPVGYLNIYLIGNEESRDSPSLSAIATGSDLQLVKWNFDDSGAAYLNAPFIMSSVYKGIQVSGSGALSGAGIYFDGSKYILNIERNISKLTLTASGKYSDLGTDVSFDSIAIHSAPAYSYLIPGKVYQGNASSGNDYFNLPILPLTEGVHWERTTIDGELGFRFKPDATILYMPEHITDDTGKPNYTYLNLYASIPGGLKVTYQLPLGNGMGKAPYTNPEYVMNNIASIPATELSINRNVHYRLNALIKKLGTLEGVVLEQIVEPWNNVTIDGTVDPPFLNVSEVQTSVNDLVKQRIYFWSNQEYIEIEPNCKIESSGASALTNTYFQNLSGTGASNFHYTYNPATKSGNGYFDIIARNLPANESCRIYLTTGNMRREVLIKSTVPSHLNTWSSKPWVGTFHRSAEVGQRIIMSLHTGNWSAEVEDPAGQGHFVLLEGATFGGDSRLFTENPGSPENYPITNGVQSISGTGRIAFKVGMTGTYNPTDAVPARYARIKVTHSNGISYLYVRQGEDPDYIMRPLDPINSGGMNQATRPNAVKVSPFNLTSSVLKSGVNQSVQLPVRGGVFVEYPTQAGAFFQQAAVAGSERYAFRPVDILDISPYPIQLSIGYWDTIGATYEVCPEGYTLSTGTTATFKTPTDGSTNASNSGSAVDSEQRQSFYENPQIELNGTGTLTNSLFGFYADGYFDRYTILASGTTVNLTSSLVAYRGRLFFNPSTYASCFFPASGYLDRSTGKLTQNSSRGSYHSTSIYQGANAWFMTFTPSHLSQQGTYFRAQGTNVRCIVTP